MSLEGLARMNLEYHEPGSDEHLNPQPDYEAQQAARDAIMQIPLFPDLPVLLKNTLDYGPHVDMLQHFVYWFHPRKPKMQKRWTLWKTFPEWKEKCGLSERQVKKGRAKLGEMGIVGWKRGQYGRIHYRVDWVALAGILGVESNSDTTGVQIDEMDDDFFDLEDGFNPDGIGGQIEPGHQGVQFNPDTVGVQPNTEEYAGGYFQESSLLQRAAEPAFAEPAAPEMNGKISKEQQEPVGDERHSQNGHAPSESTAAPPKPDDDALLAEIKAVLDPDTGWCYAGLVRVKRDFYTPKKIAESLAMDEDLPRYNGRAKELEPVVRYVFWEESRQGAAA
jgi:hypothetical protein